MPWTSKCVKNSQRNVGIARALLQETDNEYMDTVDFMDSEYPSFPHSVTTPSADTLLSPGYDINSSTKEIFAKLQKQASTRGTSSS